VPVNLGVKENNYFDSHSRVYFVYRYTKGGGNLSLCLIANNIIWTNNLGPQEEEV
jgi:hypothetical protein